jgi:MFS family permease
VGIRRVLFLAGAIVFVDTLFFAALTPLLPHYADRFDLSKSGAGLLAAAYPLGVLIGGIPSGYLAARAGVKPTAITALCLIAGTSTAFGYGDSIALLDVARFAQGLGSACAWTAALSWLVSMAPSGRRGALIGSALGVAIAGAIFGPVAGAVASVAGTGPVFAGIGGLCLLVAVLALRTPAPPPRDQEPGGLMRALTDRRILGGLWLVTLPALLFGAQGVLVPLRLSALGFGAVAIGGVYLIATTLEAGAAPLIGRITDRRGRRLPIMVGLSASALATAILPWPESAYVLAVIAVFSALSFGVCWTPAMSFVTESAERTGIDVAWGIALINLAWAPGQALGAFGGGALARATSDAVPYLALSAACLVTLAAVVHSRGARDAPGSASHSASPGRAG